MRGIRINIVKIIIVLSATVIFINYFYKKIEHYEVNYSSAGTETHSMTTTSAIIADVDAFVAQQNQTRGGPLAGGGNVPLDYDALTGAVPAGANAVTGISGIPAGASALNLPSSQIGNAVIIDGGVSAIAATSGVDSYSFLVGTNGAVTVTDNNSGNSETITGASYLVFDGGAVASTGAYKSAYIIETGIGAEIAAMFNAAFERVPDLPGLEFYAIPTVNGSLSLHQDAVFFLSSPEFAKLYPALTAPVDNGGPNDQAFVTELYGNILHRTPSAAEVQYYVEALQGSLTTSTGAAIPAADRAQLLIYFSISPENQADISASNGGWLINPANGAQNFGSMSQTAASSVLASDAAKGTINANDFSSMSSSTSVVTQGATVAGENSTIDGHAATVAQIDVSAANITVDANATFNFISASGSGDIINGYSGGGTLISMISFTAGGIAGAINLSGNGNAIQFAAYLDAPVVTPIIVNGWNSTDIIADALTISGNWGANGVVYTGSATSPVNGAAVQTSGTVAVNLGSISAVTNAAEVAAIAAAANTDYHVGGSNPGYEGVYFIAQDGANTMIYHWRGDSTSTGHVLASDFDGAVELVGVQASTLTGANFHLG